MAARQPGKSKDDTPAMRQFQHFKKLHPDCVLFFRMGDFYETFYDDAELAARVLGVTLTQRTEGIPMAGVPYHAVEGYLRRMIQAGHRVAVCDQVEDPKEAKGVVKRDVTRLITPGTITDDALLEEGRQNPLVAVAIGAPGIAAVAWAELSTGAFHVATFAPHELPDELARIGPREVLFSDDDDTGQPPADWITPSRLPSMLCDRIVRSISRLRSDAWSITRCWARSNRRGGRRCAMRGPGRLVSGPAARPTVAAF